MKEGVGKRRGITKGLEKATCYLCMRKHNVKQRLLSFQETKEMENASYEKEVVMYK
jgi:hypothetical protein